SGLKRRKRTFAGVRGSMRSLLLFSCMFRKIKMGWENGVRATPFFHSPDFYRINTCICYIKRLSDAVKDQTVADYFSFP
ncbi:hypothetical protein, partial [Hungatella effluvii]|uniref:hypothetical protein n=1 Tax=Hungatella effluvii TaxID=1096246 RepID=UPI001A9A3E7E